MFEVQYVVLLFLFVLYVVLCMVVVLFQFCQVVGWIGVEIVDVWLLVMFDDVMFDVIQVVLLCYKVLFFCGQYYFDDIVQEVFVCCFGDMVVYLIVLFVDGSVVLFEFDFVYGVCVNLWYIDVIFVDVYLKILILCVVVILLFGGDIVWVNMVVVYVYLFDLLCVFVDMLWVLYMNVYDYVLMYVYVDDV